MHLSTILLLSASLASAQYGPSQEELEHLKNINSANNDQNQNQNNGQNYNPDYNGNYGNHDADYDNYDDYENLVPSPHTPLQAQAPSPTLTHSTFAVRPSQTFVAPDQAPAPGYQYNYPTPAVSKPLPTRPAQQAPALAPAPRHQPQHPESNQDNSPQFHVPPFGSEDENASDGASGGIAPINPMKPGSQIAPPPLFPDSKYGKDEGNTFCMGNCFEEESEAKCAKPYVSFFRFFPFSAYEILV